MLLSRPIQHRAVLFYAFSECIIFTQPLNHAFLQLGCYSFAADQEFIEININKHRKTGVNLIEDDHSKFKSRWPLSKARLTGDS